MTSCESASLAVQAGWLALTATALYLIRAYQISSMQVRAIAELSKAASKVVESALAYETQKMQLRAARHDGGKALEQRQDGGTKAA